jgi:hypothetical protein
MALSKDTIDSLIAEYKEALTDEIILVGQDESLSLDVHEMAQDMRDNKKQITSLRAILKANDVDIKSI